MTHLSTSAAWMAGVAVIGITSIAAAKSTTVMSYPYAQVFPSAVRFLRINEKLTITEKDAESGYILFELKNNDKVYNGSFEVARVRDQENRRASRIVVHITDRPAYMEQGLLDRFGQKLYDEHGDPKPPPKRDRPAKAVPAKPTS